MASVDVAIPNYNYGRYLRACVESVLQQDIERLRVLIVDNASTDDSAAIARDLARADPRVELRLRDRNLGPHASFNEGIDWAQSDYFLLLCADDLLVPGALSRAAAFLDADPGVAFVYGRDIQMRGTTPMGDVEAARRAPAAWRRMSGHAFIERFCRLGVFQIPGPTIVIRTAVQKAAGHYRPELPHSDDYDVWLRLALFGDVAETDAVQAMIRVHDDNRSSELQARQLLHIRHTEMAAEHFFAHEGARLPDAARLRRLARRGLAGRAYWSAVSSLLRAGPGAAELFRYAVSRRPSAAILPPLGYLLHRPDARDRLAAILGDLAARRRLLPAGIDP